MLVTNLTNGTVGLDGIINFGPKASRDLPETQDYVERAQKLQRAGLVQIKFEKTPVAEIIEPVTSKVENVLAVLNDEKPPEESANTEPVAEVVVDKSSKKKNSVGGKN